MDDVSEQRVIKQLENTLTDKQTLVLVTHKHGVLRLVDRIIILSQTGIALDGPRDEIIKRLRDNARQENSAKKDNNNVTQMEAMV